MEGQRIVSGMMNPSGQSDRSTMNQLAHCHGRPATRIPIWRAIEVAWNPTRIWSLTVRSGPAGRHIGTGSADLFIFSAPVELAGDAGDRTARDDPR
jgi:hypothetical protein